MAESSLGNGCVGSVCGGWVSRLCAVGVGLPQVETALAVSHVHVEAVVVAEQQAQNPVCYSGGRIKRFHQYVVFIGEQPQKSPRCNPRFSQSHDDGQLSGVKQERKVLWGCWHVVERIERGERED